ncbi:MAG: hypothetical protein JSS12_05120 [Verrucomicrobia bacterium]|nr:hypothetical protein [Verrucomicrobiota bacterium]
MEIKLKHLGHGQGQGQGQGIYPAACDLAYPVLYFHAYHVICKKKAMQKSENS